MLIFNVISHLYFVIEMIGCNHHYLTCILLSYPPVDAWNVLDVNEIVYNQAQFTSQYGMSWSVALTMDDIFRLLRKWQRIHSGATIKTSHQVLVTQFSDSFFFLFCLTPFVFSSLKLIFSHFKHASLHLPYIYIVLWFHSIFEPLFHSLSTCSA